LPNEKPPEGNYGRKIARLITAAVLITSGFLAAAVVVTVIWGS
jgi:hypothetical protein